MRILMPSSSDGALDPEVVGDMMSSWLKVVLLVVGIFVSIAALAAPSVWPLPERAVPCWIQHEPCTGDAHVDIGDVGTKLSNPLRWGPIVTIGKSIQQLSVRTSR